MRHWSRVKPRKGRHAGVAEFGRRARFRSWWASARGGSNPSARIAGPERAALVTIRLPLGQWPNWLRHRSPKPAIPGSSPGCPARSNRLQKPRPAPHAGLRPRSGNRAGCQRGSAKVRKGLLSTPFIPLDIPLELNGVRSTGTPRWPASGVDGPSRSSPSTPSRRSAERVVSPSDGRANPLDVRTAPPCIGTGIARPSGAGPVKGVPMFPMNPSAPTSWSARTTRPPLICSATIWPQTNSKSCPRRAPPTRCASVATTTPTQCRSTWRRVPPSLRLSRGSGSQGRPVCTATLSDQEALWLPVRPLRHSTFAESTKS